MIWLPRVLLLPLCILAIVGHNLLDNYEATGALWHVVHEPGVIVIHGDILVLAGYVLVPWVFVMALGYAIGPVLTWPPERRRRTLAWTGGAMILAFVALALCERWRGRIARIVRAHALWPSRLLVREPDRSSVLHSAAEVRLPAVGRVSRMDRRRRRAVPALSLVRRIQAHAPRRLAVASLM
jgi:hypothetical protein